MQLCHIRFRIYQDISCVKKFRIELKACHRGKGVTDVDMSVIPLPIITLCKFIVGLPSALAI